MQALVVQTPFQGASIHPLHTTYHVFKLSDLQYVHPAMSPCVGFFNCVHRNWVLCIDAIDIYSHV